MTGLIFSPLGDRQTVRGQRILWSEVFFSPLLSYLGKFRLLTLIFVNKSFFIQNFTQLVQKTTQQMSRWNRKFKTKISKILKFRLKKNFLNLENFWDYFQFYFQSWKREMSWGAYITGEGGLLAQYDKIACGGIFGQNGSTFAQAQDRLFSRVSLAALVT